MLLIILMATAQILEATLINKCCDQDQVFDSKLHCVTHTNTHANWTFSGLDDVQFKYNVKCTAVKERRNIIIQYLEEANFTNGLMEHAGSFYSSENFCVEDFDSDDGLDTLVFMCPCSNHGCVFKCCLPNSHVVINGNVHECENNEPEQEDWQYEFVDKVTNTTMVYKFSECEENESMYRIIGNVKVWGSGVLESDKDGILQPNQYCGDYLLTENKTLESVIYGCLKNKSTDWPYAIICAISAVFFVVTAIVLHFWSPDHMWLISKMLVWHTLASAVAFVTLVMGQFPMANTAFCILTAFTMQFSFLSSFLWLNAISYEITLRVFNKTYLKSFRNMSSSKKYKWYSAYSWGGAIAISIITIIVEYSGLDKDSTFKPNFGVIKCWFRDSTALWIFFYAPVSIIIFINFILYLCNAHAIMTSKTLMLRNDKIRRCMTCFKLFLLVGITWVLEIFSWYFNSHHLAWDIMNLLRGVIIFILFGWKIIKNKILNKAENQDEFTQIYLSISPNNIDDGDSN